MSTCSYLLASASGAGGVRFTPVAAGAGGFTGLTSVSASISQSSGVSTSGRKGFDVGKTGVGLPVPASPLTLSCLFSLSEPLPLSTLAIGAREPGVKGAGLPSGAAPPVSLSLLSVLSAIALCSLTGGWRFCIRNRSPRVSVAASTDAVASSTGSTRCSGGQDAVCPGDCIGSAFGVPLLAPPSACMSFQMSSIIRWDSFRL